MDRLGNLLLQDFIDGNKHKNHCQSFEDYFKMVNGFTLGASELFEELFPSFNFPTKNYYGSLIRAKLIEQDLLMVMGIVFDVTLNQNPSYIDNIHNSYELVEEVDSLNKYIDFRVKTFENNYSFVKLPVSIKLYRIKSSQNTEVLNKIDEANFNLYSRYENISKSITCLNDKVKLKFKLCELKKHHRDYLKDGFMLEKDGTHPEVLNLYNALRLYGKNRSI